MVSMGGNRGVWGTQCPVRGSGYPDLIARVSDSRPVPFGASDARSGGGVADGSPRQDGRQREGCAVGGDTST